MTEQAIADKVKEIIAAGGRNCIVSVMLDGRPDRVEEMVLLEASVNRTQAGEAVAECVVTDLEMNRWVVDVRHVASARRAIGHQD